MRAISVKWSTLNSNSTAQPNMGSCYSTFQKGSLQRAEVHNTYIGIYFKVMGSGKESQECLPRPRKIVENSGAGPRGYPGAITLANTIKHNYTETCCIFGFWRGNSRNCELWEFDDIRMWCNPQTNLKMRSSMRWEELDKLDIFDPI